MKRVFILATLILAFVGPSQAEIWKCQKVGDSAPSYTDTPIGGEGVDCQKVETIRFTKTGEKQSRAASGSRSYAPPPARSTTKVKSPPGTAASKPTKLQKSVSTKLKAGR